RSESPPTARPTRTGWPRCAHRPAEPARTSGRQRARRSLRGNGKRRGQLLAIAVQLLHAREAALHQQAEVVEDALDDLAFPDRVELNLLVEPRLEPLRGRQ